MSFLRFPTRLHASCSATLLLALLFVSGNALAALTVNKSYSPTSIAAGSNATLTITIDNNPPPGSPGTLSFNDNYPAGIVNTSTPTANDCGGIASGSIGGNSLSLANATSLSGNHFCVVRINVTACTAGTYSDTVQVFSSNTNNPTSGTATLTVTGSATTTSATLSSVSSSAASVLADGTSTATITVIARTACGTAASGKLVTLTAGSGSSTITPINATTNASGEATFTVRNAVAEGPITYTAQVAAESITIAQTAQVTFTRLNAPLIAKSFSPATIATGGISTLRIDISNPNVGSIYGLTFTDTFPAGLTVANSPSLINTCGGTASANAGAGSLTLSGSTLAGNGSCSVSASVTAAAAGTYLNHSGAVTSNNAEPGVSASASLTVQVSVSAFNAVEIGANPVTGRLFTKRAGVGFNIDLVALDSNANVATGFTGEVAVELVNNSTGGACASLSQIAALPAETFTAGDLGRRSLSAPASSASAWRNVKVRLTHNAGASTVVSCSTDAFAIRPSSFTITSSIAADITGSNANAAPTAHAGTPFTLTASAISGYNGTPMLDPAHTQAHVGATSIGVLAGSFTSATAASGSASGNFTYAEVGYFRLAAYGIRDTDFTSVDQPGDCTADTSNALVSGRYGCQFGNTAATPYFGRFTPHHFSVLVDDSCGSFTYAGQPFTATVIAQNSTNGTTENYAGAFAKEVTLSRAIGSGGTLSGHVISTAANLFAAGTASLDTVTFNFDAPPEPAFELSLRATDSEAVSSATFVEGSTQIRSGRLRLNSGFGSGQSPLTLPIQLESWQNLTTPPAAALHAWNTESEDTCTAPLLVSGSFTITGVATTVSAVTLNPNGLGTLTLTAPGAYGTADVTACLNDITPCTGKISPWLTFDWDGDGDTDNPLARVGFEINPGNNKQIYRREVIGGN